MIDWSSCVAVERDPERVSGAWVFRGTRVPVAALFENLEDGASAEDFVDWFPGVTPEQVRAVLEHAARSTMTPATAAGHIPPQIGDSNEALLLLRGSVIRYDRPTDPVIDPSEWDMNR